MTDGQMDRHTEVQRETITKKTNIVFLYIVCNLSINVLKFLTIYFVLFVLLWLLPLYLHVNQTYDDDDDDDDDVDEMIFRLKFCFIYCCVLKQILEWQ